MSDKYFGPSDKPTSNHCTGHVDYNPASRVSPEAPCTHPTMTLVSPDRGFFCDTCGADEKTVHADHMAALPDKPAPMFDADTVDPIDDLRELELIVKVQRLEALIASYGDVPQLKKQYAKASWKVGKLKRLINMIHNQPNPELLVIKRLDAIHKDRDYSESEHFVAEYLMQRGAEYLNDDATVFGVTLGHVVDMLRDYQSYPDWDRERGAYTITNADRRNGDQVYQDAARVVGYTPTPEAQDYARRVVHQVVAQEIPDAIIIRDLRRQLAALQAERACVLLPGQPEQFAVEYYERDADGKVSWCQRAMADRPDWVEDYRNALPGGLGLIPEPLQAIREELNDSKNTITRYSQVAPAIRQMREAYLSELARIRGWYEEAMQKTQTAQLSAVEPTERRSQSNPALEEVITSAAGKTEGDFACLHNHVNWVERKGMQPIATCAQCGEELKIAINGGGV